MKSFFVFPQTFRNLPKYLRRLPKCFLAGRRKRHRGEKRPRGGENGGFPKTFFEFPKCFGRFEKCFSASLHTRRDWKSKFCDAVAKILLATGKKGSKLYLSLCDLLYLLAT